MLSTRVSRAATHVSSVFQRGQAVLQCLHRRQASFSTVPQPAVSDSDEWASARPYSEVPGPKPMPVLGNAWRFMPVMGAFDLTDPTAWVKTMEKDYGNIIKISNIPGRRDMIFIMDPNDMEKVFRNEGQWPERFSLGSIVYYRSHTRKDFFEGNVGILNENGKKWQDVRTVVNPPMMQPRNAKQYVERIDQVACDFVNCVPSWRDAKQEMPADFMNKLHKWALESIALIALDTRLGCLDSSICTADSEPQRMIDAVHYIFEGSYNLDFKMSPWKLISTPTWRKFVKATDLFMEICLKYVERAQQKMTSENGQELSVLQQILERDPSTKRAVVMAMDVIGAGIDTTSNTTAIALYYLAKNQEKQALLHQELQQLIPDPSAPLTAQQLDAMKYLKACIKESMRLKPVFLGNSRVLNKGIVLKGYHIPKGVEIIMMNFALCRKSEQFLEPDSYLPERWLRNREGSVVSGVESCPFSDHKAHPFAYLPFGFGPRQCVGMRFANLEMETLIARMIRQYRIEYLHGEMKFESKMLTIPGEPLTFKITDRNI